MKKIIIVFLFILIFFCGSEFAFAWTPPDNCSADSWVMIHDNSSAYVNFFLGSDYACSRILKQGGNDIVWGGNGFIFDSSGKINKNEMSTTVSFFAGLLAITAFIAGVNGGKGV